MPAIYYAVSIGLECRAAYQLKRVFKAACPSGVFNWQITPPSALAAYFENNFRGNFELPDLYVERETAVVVHRRLGTRHQHEFPPDVTERTLPTFYDQARRRHEYLSEKVRRLLASPRPLLLATCRHHDIEANPVVVEALVRKARKSRPFYLLHEPPGGDVGADWRGSDEVWDDALRPFVVPGIAKVWSRLQLYVRPKLAVQPHS